MATNSGIWVSMKCFILKADFNILSNTGANLDTNRRILINVIKFTVIWKVYNLNVHVIENKRQSLLMIIFQQII